MKPSQSLQAPLFYLVEGGGFEPPKVEPADLQSAPFGRSGTPPKIKPRILLEHDTTVNRNTLIRQIFFCTKKRRLPLKFLANHADKAILKNQSNQSRRIKTPIALKLWAEFGAGDRS